MIEPQPSSLILCYTSCFSPMSLSRTSKMHRTRYEKSLCQAQSMESYFTKSLSLVSWSHRRKQKRGKHHFMSQNGFLTKRKCQGQSRYFFFWLISRSLLFTGGIFHGHLPLHCVVYLIGAWCHSAWCTWWDHLLPKTRRQKALRATGEKENTGLW